MLVLAVLSAAIMCAVEKEERPVAVEKEERPVDSEVIVSLHVATGAIAGSLVGSPLHALLLGPALHLASERSRGESG
jgi:hypothetical protein